MAFSTTDHWVQSADTAYPCDSGPSHKWELSVINVVNKEIRDQTVAFCVHYCYSDNYFSELLKTERERRKE